MGMGLITLEVLRNKFGVITDEMEITLLKSAYSSIVKEGMDAAAALFTTGGETIAQAASIPIHLGSLVPAGQRILQEFPAQAWVERADGSIEAIPSKRVLTLH
jgi:N-methylhydantoinase B